MAEMIIKFICCAIGVLAWVGVIWDGFATIVLPRTVAPMWRLSGRFTRLSWRVWAAAGRRIRDPERCLSFLAIYGPVSVMFLLILWAFLVIVAFALIDYSLGTQFRTDAGPVHFGGLIYMSASTFLTLGLGDVTSPHPFDRFLVIAEAATGFVFLGLIITYMPLLDQAYSAREIGNLLLHSRAGSPPTAIRLLHRYSDSHHTEILRSNLRESERWMAETLQSHLSHPVLSFYRAQHFGQSWLVSLTTAMDGCALLIVGGEGLVREQARLTYRMGIRLLADLAHALAIPVDPPARPRLAEADLPAIRMALTGAGLALTFGPAEEAELVRLSNRYDLYVQALSTWLLIALPSWIPPGENLEESRAWVIPGASDPINV
jgi:hypothetical protein